MTFSLRRLIITIIFVLIIGAASVISVFLSTFDLNHFRGQISDTISSRLSQPVDLGQAHFSIKHGPSFAFDKIRIGTKSAPLYLTAEHLFFRLEVLPLLTGDIKFLEILFEQPNVTLKIGQSPATNKGDRRLFFDQSLFSGDLVSSIRIKNGHFRIEDYRNSQTPFIVALEKMRLVVDDLSLRQSGWVEIQTNINCNDIRSPLRLSGYIKAGDSTPFWNNANYDLEMQISDFASDLLSQRYQNIFSRFQIHGRTDIHTQLSGSPAEGLFFNTVLSGRDLGVKMPGKKEPIPAETIAVSGRWQNKEKYHKIDDLKFQFGPMNFFGETFFDLAKDDPVIYAKLSAPQLALIDFNRFFRSEQEVSAPAKRLEFTSGTFNLQNLEISAPLSNFSDPNLLLAIRKIDLKLQRGALSIGKVPKLSDCSFELTLDKQTLSLKELRLNTRDIHAESYGELKIEKGEQADELNLVGQGNLNVSNRNLPDRTGKRLLPEQGLKAVLHLAASHSNGIWTLNNNLLALPSAKIILQGNWDWKSEKAYTFDLDIPELNLLDLPLISPAIKTIQPDGKMSAKVRLSGGKNIKTKLQGTMALEQVHLRMLGPLAALDDLTGSIELDWPYLSGDNLKVNLGTSPINLGLEIPDLTQPRVDLTIKGKSIRANELIFRSEKTYLRDVDAKVSITDEALILGPIHTRMDGGTDVNINGTIDNFPAADTRLTIEGKYGNIDEVIGLWISDQDITNKKRKKRKQGLLEIDIRTDAGEIAHLPFEQSEGHISYRDRTLVIHPISFKSGPGYGLGQVLVTFRDNQPPLLKLSGHFEDFDALAVYQQLLQRKGIVTGKLKGDFYLEGTAGKLKEVFLPSSTGSFSVTVKDGVLEKLQGLSKTLTVFNIYPLFTSSDSSKGVPFERLTGNAILKKGILRTDNTFMKGDVMNMSMVGTQNLITSEVDLELGIMPLRTIDRLLTNIPLAGWILTGKDKALVTAHFKMTGPGDDPEITAIPIESASKQVLGIFKRLFTLPVKIISDVGEAID